MRKHWAIPLVILVAISFYTLGDMYRQLWGTGDNPTVPDYGYASPPATNRATIAPPKPATIDYNEWNRYIHTRAPTKMGIWEAPKDPGWEEILPEDPMPAAPTYNQLKRLETYGIIRADHAYGTPPSMYFRPRSVPEPESWAMLLTGLAGCIVMRYWRRNR